MSRNSQRFHFVTLKLTLVIDCSKVLCSKKTERLQRHFTGLLMSDLSYNVKRGNFIPYEVDELESNLSYSKL